MSAGEYEDAVESYERLPRSSTKDESDLSLLAIAFNYSEARRRAGRPVAVAELKEIVALYERGAATEGVGSYALLGDIERSRQLLQQVRDLAGAVSPRERIFSVASYTHIPLDQLLQQTKEMIEALDAGKLWDGTPLPATQA